jgi:hypothetical protein
MNRDVEEEMPAMRAVSLATPTAVLKVSAQAVEREIAVPVLNSLNDPLALESKSHSSSVARFSHGWNKCNWKVSALNEVPLDFPLQRTRREIDEVPIGEVVDRITKCLRQLSIEAEFDGENAKAKCKTSDMVSFRVRLFAGEARKQESIIVEIQRRSGPALSFMRVCTKLLDAAEGAEIKPESISARKKMPSFIIRTPVSKMKFVQKVDIQDPRIAVNTGLNKSFEMLRSKKLDVNLLGLENLCFMTDPLKTNPNMALISCKALILGEYWTDIRDEVGEMLNNEDFLAEKFDSHPWKDLFDKCHHLAIVVMANILALTSHDGCLDDAVQNQKWFTEFLIPSLLDEVRSFKTSSNNAYEAACGLNYLARCSDVARRKMKENSAIDDIQSANQFATYNHDLLASETKSCLELLINSI